MSCWVSSWLMHPLDREWRHYEGITHARQANRSAKLPSLLGSFFESLFWTYFRLSYQHDIHLGASGESGILLGIMDLMASLSYSTRWWDRPMLLRPRWCACRLSWRGKRVWVQWRRLKFLDAVHGLDIFHEKNGHWRNETKSKSKGNNRLSRGKLRHCQVPVIVGIPLLGPLRISS